MSTSGIITRTTNVVRGKLPPISQNFTTSQDYWTKNAEIPGNARNEYFYEYSLLYEGDSDLVVKSSDFPVSLVYRNWFAEVANFYRDFLMSTPPESNSSLIDMLNNQLRPALISLITHGVAIIAVEPQLIRSVDPRYFYPLDGFFNGGRFAAEVYPFGSKHVRVRMLNSIRTFSFDSAGDNWNYPTGSLGQDTADTLETGSAEYFVISLDPVDGLFGASVFREMLPAVAAYTELMSSYVSQLKTSANILSIERITPSDAIATNLPNIAPTNHPNTPPIQLAQLYGTAVENAKLSFVSGVIDPEAFRLPLDRAEQQIYSISALSPTLVGQFQDRSTLVQSGVAFTKSFIRTSARISEIIAEWLPMLSQILTAAGSPADIVWPHPLEALDALAETSAAAPNTGDNNASNV